MDNISNQTIEPGKVVAAYLAGLINKDAFDYYLAANKDALETVAAQVNQMMLPDTNKDYSEATVQLR